MHGGESSDGKDDSCNSYAKITRLPLCVNLSMASGRLEKGVLVKFPAGEAR